MCVVQVVEHRVELEEAVGANEHVLGVLEGVWPWVEVEGVEGVEGMEVEVSKRRGRVRIHKKGRDERQSARRGVGPNEHEKLATAKTNNNKRLGRGTPQPARHIYKQPANETESTKRAGRLARSQVGRLPRGGRGGERPRKAEKTEG